VIVDEQMPVGRGRVDAPGNDRHAFGGLRRRQRTGFGQHGGDPAGHGRRQMGGDEHGRGQVGRQVGHQLLQRFQAAGGCTDHHDVPAHALSFRRRSARMPTCGDPKRAVQPAGSS
jgi:hypothetical protein